MTLLRSWVFDGGWGADPTMALACGVHTDSSGYTESAQHLFIVMGNRSMSLCCMMPNPRRRTERRSHCIDGAVRTNSRIISANVSVRPMLWNKRVVRMRDGGVLTLKSTGSGRDAM
jgi:hypothetical protein